MIDDLATWKTTFAALTPTTSSNWTIAFAQWVNDRVTGKALVAEITHASTPFTFAQATFKAQLDTLTATLDRNTGATAFANAWRAAIDASAYTTVAGDYVNPPPATALNTWSVVNSSVIDVASRASAQAQMIVDLNAASNVLNVADSELPKILRDAFLGLTISVTGLNSVLPPTGPNALAVTGASLT